MTEARSGFCDRAVDIASPFWRAMMPNLDKDFKLSVCDDRPEEGYGHRRQGPESREEMEQAEREAEGPTSLITALKIKYFYFLVSKSGFTSFIF